MLLRPIPPSNYETASHYYEQWETITTQHPKMIQNLILPENLKLTFQIKKQ